MLKSVTEGSLLAWRSEADSRCRSAVQQQAVLTVEQPDGQQGALLLWGAAVDWLPRFRRDRGTHTHIYTNLKAQLSLKSSVCFSGCLGLPRPPGERRFDRRPPGAALHPLEHRPASGPCQPPGAGLPPTTTHSDRKQQQCRAGPRHTAVPEIQR